MKLHCQENKLYQGKSNLQAVFEEHFLLAHLYRMSQQPKARTEQISLLFQIDIHCPGTPTDHSSARYNRPFLNPYKETKTFRYL